MRPTAVAREVVSRPLRSVRTLAKQAERVVAGAAEQPTNFARDVVMVDVEALAWRPAANLASTTLRLDHRVVLVDRDPVGAPKVTIPITQPSLWAGTRGPLGGIDLVGIGLLPRLHSCDLALAVVSIPPLSA